MDDPQIKHPIFHFSHSVHGVAGNQGRSRTAKLNFASLRSRQSKIPSTNQRSIDQIDNQALARTLDQPERGERQSRSLPSQKPSQKNTPETKRGANFGLELNSADVNSVAISGSLRNTGEFSGIVFGLQQMINAMPSAVWIKNCENVIVGANNAALQASALTRDQLVGSSCEELYGELGKKYFEDDLEVIKSGRPKQNIIEPFFVNGQQKWIRTSKTPIRDSQGKVQGLIVVTDDITGELQTVEDLRNTNREFEGLFDTINYGMAGITADGQINFANRRFDEMLNRVYAESRRTFNSSDHLIFDYLPLLPFNERTLARLAKNAQEKPNVSLSYRTTCRRRDKTEFPASIKISNVRRYGNDFLLVEVYDETETIQATDRLRMTLECADAGCWEIDLQRRTLSLILGSAESFGFDEAVQPLTTWQSLIHPDDQALVKRTFRQAIQNANSRFSAVFRARQPDGCFSSTLFRGELTRDLRGRVLGIIGVHIDIDRQVSMETELRDALKNQRRLNTELDSFAYAVSHDLKAPLRGVKNIANLLVFDPDTQLSSEGHELCELLSNRIVRMENLLADVLAFSRSGFGNGKSEPVDTRKTVWNLFRDVNVDSKCRLECDSDLPQFETLRVPFEQVIRNLLSNAVNYSQGQLPVVKVECLERPDSYLFSVIDSGLGIEKKFHERIFLPFKTLHRSSENGGTGLGLALVRKQVRAVGGQIWVESELGHGATFKFEWPKLVQQSND